MELPAELYGQIVLYTEVTLAGNPVQLTVQFSHNKADWRGLQIIRPAVVPDAEPPAYTVQYNVDGKKPALIVPLAASWIRVLVVTVGGVPGAAVTVLAELGFSSVEAVGT